MEAVTAVNSLDDNNLRDMMYVADASVTNKFSYTAMDVTVTVIGHKLSVQVLGHKTNAISFIINIIYSI